MLSTFRLFRQSSRICGSSSSINRASAALRCFSLHEYQSQQLMRDHGINVPRGFAVETREAALDAAKSLGGQDIVVKAQVLAGGRGLGTFKNGFKRGVHICYNPDRAADIAERMIGQHLVTKQTGAQGRLCSKALITERLYLRREMYFAITYDRASQGAVIVVSRVGGTSIEDIAASDPTAITKVPISIKSGLSKDDVRKCAIALGFDTEGRIEKAMDQVEKLYSLFLEKDATLLEINPLAETSDGDVVCVDAKINFDDNASFRHKDVYEQRDLSQEDPREVRASTYDLNYIGLDGNIGCLVNGAGLAMATMDIIKLHGGEPANFLDVGGSATESQVKEAFTILNEDKQVEAILVNIFGGIMRCDVIAQGIIGAANSLDMRIPVVVRLQGNKVGEARQLIRKSGLKIITSDDLDQAAMKACKLAEIVRLSNEAHVHVDFASV